MVPTTWIDSCSDDSFSVINSWLHLIHYQNTTLQEWRYQQKDTSQYCGDLENYKIRIWVWQYGTQDLKDGRQQRELIETGLRLTVVKESRNEKHQTFDPVAIELCSIGL